MKKGRSLKQSLGLLCGLIAAACAVLYSIGLCFRDGREQAHGICDG